MLGVFARALVPRCELGAAVAAELAACVVAGRGREGRGEGSLDAGTRFVGELGEGCGRVPA